MFPFFNLFGKEISMYTICSLIGVLIAGWFCLKQAKKQNLDDNKLLVATLWGAVGAFFGSHFLYGLLNLNYIIYYIQNFTKIKSFSDFIDVCIFIFGGAVFYGGLIGGLIVGFFAMKKTDMDFGKYTDIIAPAIPLFHCFGRIGCFCGGCCYGIPSHIGVTFTCSPVVLANNICRFPVSLLESTFNLLLFLFLYICFRKKFFKNNLIFVYLLCYSTARFFIEFLRDDAVRGHFLCFSTSQWISIFLFITTITIIVIKYVKRHNQKCNKNLT